MTVKLSCNESFYNEISNVIDNKAASVVEMIGGTPAIHVRAFKLIVGQLEKIKPEESAATIARLVKYATNYATGSSGVKAQLVKKDAELEATKKDAAEKDAANAKLLAELAEMKKLLAEKNTEKAPAKKTSHK
ncbi:MAG: hypothetical protein PHX51_08570 [Clostridia bacterium]|nr:hypothetical protein [Clostridia bacterium]